MTRIHAAPLRPAVLLGRTLFILLCCHGPVQRAGADALDALVFTPQPLHGAQEASADLPLLLAAMPITASLPYAAVPARFPDSIDAAGTLQAHAAAIERLAAEAGPYAPALGEHYLALARLQQTAGDHAAAREHLAKAEHLIRINEGLKSPALFRPVSLDIASLLAQGEFQQAIERQEYLVYLHQAHFGREAADVVPALVALGDMYFTAFERQVRRDVTDADLMPRFGPETGYREVQELTPMDIAFLWLQQAQARYYDCISRLLAQGKHFDPLLPRLENAVIETLFLQTRRRALELDGEYFVTARDSQRRDTLVFDEKAKQLPAYRDGVEAFERILSYLHHNPSVDRGRVATAMIELGDWHMLFGRSKAAEGAYANARAYLDTHGVPEAERDALLNPAVPVQLPVFVAQPHTTAGSAVDYTGYIDVALTLDRNGRIARLDVLDKSPNAEPAIEARLKKVLRSAPFRPPLALAGQDSAAIALRYNFGWL